jgi:hypothetical protein
MGLVVGAYLGAVVAVNIHDVLRCAFAVFLGIVALKASDQMTAMHISLIFELCEQVQERSALFFCLVPVSEERRPESGS